MPLDKSLKFTVGNMAGTVAITITSRFSLQNDLAYKTI